MFQIKHLEDAGELAPLVGTTGAHVNFLRMALREGPAFAALRSPGYQIVATLPGYGHVAEIANPDASAGTP